MAIILKSFHVPMIILQVNKRTFVSKVFVINNHPEESMGTSVSSRLNRSLWKWRFANMWSTCHTDVEGPSKVTWSCQNLRSLRQVLCSQKPKKIFLLQQDNKRCSDYFIMKMTEGTTLDLTRKEVDLKPLLLEDQNHHERPTEFWGHFEPGF